MPSGKSLILRRIYTVSVLISGLLTAACASEHLNKTPHLFLKVIMGGTAGPGLLPQPQVTHRDTWGPSLRGSLGKDLKVPNCPRRKKLLEDRRMAGDCWLLFLPLWPWASHLIIVRLGSVHTISGNTTESPVEACDLAVRQMAQIKSWYMLQLGPALRTSRWVADTSGKHRTLWCCSHGCAEWERIPTVQQVDSGVGAGGRGGYTASSCGKNALRLTGMMAAQS